MSSSPASDKFRALNKEFLLTLLDHISDGVYFVTPERQIIYWNKTAEAITGFQANEVVGRYCYDNILNHISAQGTRLCQNGCPLQQTLQDGHPRKRQLFLQHKKGHRVPVHVRVQPVRDRQGKIIGAVETFAENREILYTKQKLHQLQRTVLLDPLTGIGNRRHIERRLSASLLTYQQLGIPFGVAMIDIDFFKRINDTFGHDVGDRMLRVVANTLRRNLRANDTVGRWGGEEFLALITEVNYQSLRAASEKLRIMVAESRLQVEGYAISVTVSIGATLARQDDTSESLVQRSDHLLYHSKHQGRNRVTIG